MPQFPSVEWFEAVRESANGDSQFTSQGSVNCRMGVNGGWTQPRSPSHSRASSAPPSKPSGG